MQDQRTRPYHKAALYPAVILTFLTATSFGESVLIYPSMDTSLLASSPGNNLGANSNLIAGVNGSGLPARALIRFDLGQIPANALIQSASLKLNVVIVPGSGGAASTFDLRRVQADWNEGTGTGNLGVPAMEGEATWMDRMASLEAWTTPGGGIGSDYSDTVSSSTMIGGIGSYTFPDSRGLKDDLKHWLETPAENFGWVLISESEGTPFTARRFGSKEDPNHRPTLSVTYAVKPPAMFLSIQRTNQVTSLTFAIEASRNYQVDFLDAIAGGSWHPLITTNSVGVTSNLTVLDHTSTNSQRFYRLGTF